VRAPSDEGELVRPGASGDAVSAEALWDAHGARAFAFCARMVGDAAAAADAAQDAFLLAHSRRSRPRQARPTFAAALFSAARTTSFELLGRRDRAVEPRARGRLSAAALRLRPHQRAALA
jgi:DNA-directed RNA polymerase specialized sigma24 family protein